jgi:hypothetical protein
MEGSKLGGLWKDPSLVALERFHAWWPLEGSKLVGLERFQTLWPLEGSKLVDLERFQA